MRTDLQRALANQPVAAEAVMSDADRTQFIARSGLPPVAVRRIDEPPPGPDDDRRSGLVWLAVVIALLLVIGAAVAAIFLIGRSDSVAKVTVPQSVIGELPGAAQDTLRAAKLNPVAGDDTNGPCFGNATVDKGQVCTLEPGPNTKVNEKSTVVYHLYTPKQVQVPDLTGKQYTDAAAILHNLNLVAKQKIVNNAADVGTVIAQSAPPFSNVAPGAAVTLSVSSGKTVLPDVRNLKDADAKVKLNSAGWTNIDDSQTVNTPDKAKDGTVKDENPTPGIAYPQNTKIALVIYKYVKPAPTCVTPSGGITGIPTGLPTGGLPPCTS
jgi:serine/threonine-protein kinase